MTDSLLAKKLARVQAKVAVLENMIEDKTRALFLANEELETSLEYQREIYRILPEALLVLRKDRTIKAINRSTTSLLGYSREECARMPVEFLWPTAQEILAEVDVSGPLAGREFVWMTSDGTGVPVLVSVSALATKGGEVEYLCLASDLRERQQLEAETRHAQKLQSVGQLAAGVAHEINTPMQFVGDNVHFLQESFVGLLKVVSVLEDAFDSLPDGTLAEPLLVRVEQTWEEADIDYVRERGPQAFARALDGVERVSNIVAAMKSFSHPGGDMAPADLNRVIETTLTVAANEYKYIAEVALELEALPAVWCHVGDINQVLLNLIVNAAHAIGDDTRRDGEKGRITIRSTVDGGMAQISISDSGCGIPEHVQPRIFEPFFTTKEVGRGTGQGLSLAHSIISEKHGGSLTFETQPGSGTTFFVKLPLENEATRVPQAGAVA